MLLVTFSPLLSLSPQHTAGNVRKSAKLDCASKKKRLGRIQIKGVSLLSFPAFCQKRKRNRKQKSKGGGKEFFSLFVPWGKLAGCVRLLPGNLGSGKKFHGSVTMTDGGRPDSGAAVENLKFSLPKKLIPPLPFPKGQLLRVRAESELATAKFVTGREEPGPASNMSC